MNIMIKRGKEKFKLTIPIVLAILGISARNIYGMKYRLSEPLPFSAPQYEFEDLKMELYSNGVIVFVSGKIRNLSHVPVQGYVVVYFRNKNNNVVHATETDVNKGKPFIHDETGYFEATENLSNHPGAENVSVEFVNQ